MFVQIMVVEEMFPIAHLGIPLLPFIATRKNPIDYRLLLIGCLLPDIIDKPLGHLILSENNGRIFAHTILFSLVILLLAIRFRRLLPLSLGISTHQFLDLMYLDPEGAFWPLMGGFRTTDFQIVQWFDAALEPVVLTGEIIGLVALIIIFFRNDLHRPDRFLRMLRTGN